MSDRFSERAQILDEIDEYTERSWLMRLNYHFLDPEEVEPMGAELRLRCVRGHFQLKPFDGTSLVSR